jgi:hypothetical protein
LGDQRWRNLLEAHHTTVRRELARFRGNEVRSLGDGFLATFDGPARAVLEFTEKPDGEPTPTADAKDKLERMAEFRNEQKAAQDFMKEAVEKQKSLAQRANRQQPASFNQLAPEEKTLEKSLEDFQAQHPQAFRNAKDEMKAAGQSMNNAAQNLEKRNAAAKKDTQQAAEKLEQLRQAVQKQDAVQQLADAYKLKEMLDQEIKTLGQCQNSGGRMSDAQVQRTASAAKATTDQLKKLAEQTPASDVFGPKLGESLSNVNKQLLDQKLDEAGTARGDEAKQQAAGAAKSGLEKVAQAFDESQPGHGKPPRVLLRGIEVHHVRRDGQLRGMAERGEGFRETVLESVLPFASPRRPPRR